MDEEIEIGADESFAGDQSRRSMLKKAAIGGAVAWVAPTVLSASGAAAASVAAQYTCQLVQLAGSIGNTGSTAVQEWAFGPVPISYNGTGSVVISGADNGGNASLFVDDMLVVKITKPDASVQVLWFDCFNNGGCTDPGYGPVTLLPFPGGPVDITPYLQANATTPNSIEIFGWNCIGDTSWTDVWLCQAP